MRDFHLKTLILICYGLAGNSFAFIFCPAPQEQLTPSEDYNNSGGGTGGYQGSH